MESESVIRDNTKEMAEMNGRLIVVERSLTDLEASINHRMLRLETAMQSSNAHLDNISRESARTNELLEEELRSRREQDKRREEWLREDQKETKNLAVNAAREIWEISKQPFAYLIAAAVAYFAWAWLQQHSPSVDSINSRPVAVTPSRAEQGPYRDDGKDPLEPAN